MFKTMMLAMAALSGVVLVAAMAAADDGHKATREILEAKGLKQVRQVYLLDEEVASSHFQREITKFRELHTLDEKLTAIDSKTVILEYAQSLRSGTAFDNSDLNIAMDSIPRRGGPRENSLNNVQKEMHYQLLANRQAIADLDRFIAQLKADLRALGNRQAQGVRFEKLHKECLASLDELEKEMAGVAAKYRDLAGDKAVMDALDQIKKSTKATVKLGPSDDFKNKIVMVKREKALLLPQPAQRKSASRKGR